MYDELTEIDIQKMREEIDHRVRVLRPKLIEDVQAARAFGDLSENYEYKVAKQEKNRNESRIRYLERMIRTAKQAVPEMVVISDTCFCEYTDHGHCGVIVEGHVHNDQTLQNIGRQAVNAAAAGADMSWVNIFVAGVHVFEF